MSDLEPAKKPDSKVDVLWFMYVPAPGSGNVVEALRSYRTVVSAAAVYAEIDVVAQLHGSERQLARTKARLLASGAPVGAIEEFKVDQIYRGDRYHDRSIRMSTSCRAFIRCETGLNGNERRFAARALANLECVAAVYESLTSGDLVVEVVAADKTELDAAVMAKVQGEWKIVRSTRSYIAINHSMSWSRWLPADQPDIFISFAIKDEFIVARIREQLERDTGLKIWMSSRSIPVGAPSWPRTVDEALAGAPLHLYMLSDSFRESAECQREFGMSLATVAHPEDICAFILPGCNFSEFDTRYRIRNCLFAEQLLAYPELLMWIRSQLRFNAIGRASRKAANVRPSRDLG